MYIDLDLTDEELLVLFKEAHLNDLTFNEYINNVIRQIISVLKQDQE